MKKVFLGVFVLAGASVASANDGGMAVIDVDRIKAKPVISEGKTTGTEIIIRGEGARSLMAIIPAEAGVHGAADHVKSLAIAARNSKNDVIISCTDVKITWSEKGTVMTPIVPTCNIALDTHYENEFGDSWKFSPDEVCRK